MGFFNTFTHLLPNAKAWRLTIYKNLRKFFEGLAPVGDDVKTFADNVFLDTFPQTTRELDAWELQFGLPPSITNVQERRDRVDGAWKALGGQSPRYIQDTLQNAGFDVYVHEWWEPNSSRILVDAQDNRDYMQDGDEEAFDGNGAYSSPIARNPHNYLEDGSGYPPTMQDGKETSQDGNAEAEDGQVYPLGYPLVNIPVTTIVIPVDPTKYPYFLYIGGEVFAGFASVPLSRKNEFEALCLKICPTQQWLGMLVNYV